MQTQHTIFNLLGFYERIIADFIESLEISCYNCFINYFFGNTMKKLIKIASLSVFSAGFFVSNITLANSTPIGLWKTINEDTNQAKSYVRITQTNHVLSGKVETILDPSKQADICDECEGDLKNKPILGMTIITNVKDEGDGVWGEGEILDPTNGKTYTVQLTPQNDGKKLEVRGYIGFFYRNQYWERVE